ncbi:hypothetical protein SA3056_SA3056_02252 [Staphylococcus aureus]|nr:hypothetical protein SA3102_SA3102_01534 [Staphylococcus aureus]CAH0011841.1 hypothetical protein SA3056_SA3056_02252 [Staphylococcus aureus]
MKVNYETGFQIGVMEARLKEMRKQRDEYKKQRDELIVDIAKLRERNKDLEKKASAWDRYCKSVEKDLINEFGNDDERVKFGMELNNKIFMKTTKTYPALAFENKDKAGLYIGLLDAWCQDPDEAILYVNKDGSKPDKKKAKEIILIREKNYSDLLKEVCGEENRNCKPSEWFEICNLVDVEISEERFKEMFNNE